MLNGIGGNTIYEAQKNLGYKEYISWVKYKNKHGTLSGGVRVEKTLAYVAMQFASAMLKKKSGGQFEFSDLSFWSEKEPDQYGGVNEVFSLLSSIAVKEEK